MLNLPDPKNVWQDQAKNAPSNKTSPNSESSLADTVVRKLSFGLLSLSGSQKGDEDEEESEDVFQVGEEEESRDQANEQSVSFKEPIRPTIANRRHLQRPPRNVSIESHSPQPLPSAANRKTPKTAILREDLEGRINEAEVMEMVEAYANDRVKRDRREHGIRHQPTPAYTTYKAEDSAKSKALSELHVRILLLPAVLLLSRPKALKAEDVENAMRYARSAQAFAQSNDVESALQARCFYYIGLAAFLLLPKHVMLTQGRPASVGSFSELAKPETVQAYFEQATAAKGVYAEGAWAEEWVKYMSLPEVKKELSESVEDARPSSSGSWVTGWLKNFWGPKGAPSSHQGQPLKQRPNKILRRRKDSNASTATDTTDRPTAPERIPSFESYRSDETSTVTTSAEPSPATVPLSDLLQRIQTFQALSSPREDTSEEILPLPVTSPQTSPTKRLSSFALARHSSSPSRSQSVDVSASSPLHERRHSRRPSLMASALARVTGRDRRPSELEDAEEGHSPYRATFAGVSEVGEVRRRKGSAGDAVGEGDEMV